ncbi:MAG TPA: acyl-ACP thioesterase [Clostridiaceae bacterium]|nr:acyl-ACP thioesterase [Clostridiaceae bacterium]
MELKSKLSKKYQIMVNDVDFTKKLKLSAIFNYFQEIAGLHADELGIGFNTIQRKFGVVWVLIRIRVDIMEYPLWNDEIIIETWPQLPRKFEFDRDYIVRDLHGNIIARAVSTWVILDAESRRLQKSDVIAIDYPPIIKERAIDCILGKLKPYSEPKLAYKRVIGCSDIDINGHLNNSKYIDFIMDCFTMDEIKKYRARSIQVNYMDEALPGNTIVMRRCRESYAPNIIYVDGLDENSNNTVFRALIDIVPNE